MLEDKELQEILMLEAQEQTIDEKYQNIFISEVERVNLQQAFNILCGNRKFKDNEIRYFDATDLRKVFNVLGQSNIHQQDLDQMIWEADENLDGKIDDKEFDLLYKKCIEDKVHLEPKNLFYLVQFLMYCKKTLIQEDSEKNFIQNKKYKFESSIVSEDTYSLIYARYDRQYLDGSQREKLDQEIRMIFGETERNPDGTDWTVNYQEFVKRINESIIEFRKDFKLKQKYLSNSDKGKEGS